MGLALATAQHGDAQHSRGLQLMVDLGWWRQFRASQEVTEEEAEPQVCHLGCPGNIAVLN